MNPDTNQFEKLIRDRQEDVMDKFVNAIKDKELESNLLRPNGEPVPKHWTVFTVGENVVIKDYTFKVAYIGESNILFEPVGPVAIKSEE